MLMFLLLKKKKKKIIKKVIIKQVVENKFLGVIIAQHLSWKSHIIFISKKISKTVHEDYCKSSRFYLSSKSLLTLNYSLVYPSLTCCNATWTNNLEFFANYTLSGSSSIFFFLKNLKNYLIDSRSVA